MSILSKDFTNTAVIGVGSQIGTLATEAYTTTAVYTTPGVSAGPQGTLPLIISYPDVSTTTLAKAIRVATAGEVAQVRAHLCPGLVEPFLTTAFNGILYGAEFGHPLYFTTEGYVAMWHGDHGAGLYVFIGYDSTHHPTQDIDIIPGAQVLI